MSYLFAPLRDWPRHGILVDSDGKRSVATFIPKTNAARLTKVRREELELLAKIEREAQLPSRLG